MENKDFILILCDYSGDWFSSQTMDTKIKILGLIGAIIAFAFSFGQYVKSQQWKKAEFLASEYKYFLEHDAVQMSFLMLDGFPTNISYINKKGEEGVVNFEPEKLPLALEKLESDPDREFNFRMEDDMVQIRLCIDEFLFKLGVFQIHIDSDLIKPEKVKPYLIYWIKLMADPLDTTIQKSTKDILHKYIQENGFYFTKKLFETCGHPI